MKNAGAKKSLRRLQMLFSLCPSPLERDAQTRANAAVVAFLGGHETAEQLHLKLLIPEARGRGHGLFIVLVDSFIVGQRAGCSDDRG